MFFTKFPHKANFSYATGFDASTGRLSAGTRRFDAAMQRYADGVYRLQVSGEAWGENRSLIALNAGVSEPCSSTLAGDLGFTLKSSKGPVLATAEGASFGVCGDTWMLQFEIGKDARFFGMGEKNFGRLELSGIRTKFWSTDVWSDFHIGQWTEDVADPPYFSLPYLVVKTANGYVGILNHTAAPAFFETPSPKGGEEWPIWVNTGKTLVVGAECGKPDVWFIVAPTLKELTRKLMADNPLATYPRLGG